MPALTISEVARRIGLRPSAIRYYERLKILPPAKRVSGQRRYDETALYRLTVVRQAQEVGFSLSEIRLLFGGFRDRTPSSERWNTLASGKLAELDAQLERIRGMKELLEKLKTRCQCATLEECGERMLRRR